MPQWYSAVLVLRSHVGAGSDAEAVLDHQVRLIAAADPEAAYASAIQLGKREEHSYRNAEGQEVRWEFVGLHDLVELIEPPANGAEVYSWLTGHSDQAGVRPKPQLAVFRVEAEARRKAQHP